MKANHRNGDALINFKRNRGLQLGFFDESRSIHAKVWEKPRDKDMWIFKTWPFGHFYTNVCPDYEQSELSSDSSDIVAKDLHMVGLMECL